MQNDWVPKMLRFMLCKANLQVRLKWEVSSTPPVKLGLHNVGVSFTDVMSRQL
jgi:hypothetical protein